MDDYLRSYAKQQLLLFLVLASISCNKKKSNFTPLKKPTLTENITPQKSKKSNIYLTFDDGPNKGSKNLIQILKKQQIPVTLFFVGEHLKGSKYQDSITQIVLSDTNILICNHSFTHAHNQYKIFYSNVQNVVADIDSMQNSLPMTTSIVRLPGRNIWQTNNIKNNGNSGAFIATDSLTAKGYDILGWDVEWHQNNKSELLTKVNDLIFDIDSVLQNNKCKTKDNCVVLAHDQMFGNDSAASQLNKFIEDLKKSDKYEFKKMNDYPGIN